MVPADEPSPSQVTRRKALHVVDLTPERPFQQALRGMLAFLDLFETEAGPTTTNLVRDRRRGGFHPDHNRMLKRGDMSMEVSYCGIGRTGSLVANVPSEGGACPISVEVPLDSNGLRCPDRTLAYLRNVMERVLDARLLVGDLTIVETWSQGIAAMAMGRGSTQVGVRMPSPWTPLEVDADDGTYESIPSSARRRISSACPFILNVEHGTPTESRPCRIMIDWFSRQHPPMDGSAVDPVSSMRNAAMVLEAAGMDPSAVSV